MSKLKYKAMYKSGTYKDSSGEEKTRWLQVGAVFESDRGSLSMKLEAVPVGTNGPVFLNLVEPRRDS